MFLIFFFNIAQTDLTVFLFIITGFLVIFLFNYVSFQFDQTNTMFDFDFNAMIAPTIILRPHFIISQ